MNIDGISDIYDDFDTYALRSNGNIEIKRDEEFPKVILSTFDMKTFRKLDNVKPLSGSAKVSVETDGEGNTSASGEISVQSDDGKCEVSGEISVDQDGNVSGKASVGVNWKE